MTSVELALAVAAGIILAVLFFVVLAIVAGVALTYRNVPLEDTDQPTAEAGRLARRNLPFKKPSNSLANSPFSYRADSGGDRPWHGKRCG